MGTNYYAEQTHLVEPATTLHLGKSSAGWCFALHIYPDMGISSYADMIAMLERCSVLGIHEWQIKDEYGRNISISEFKGVVANRNGGPKPLRLSFQKSGWYSSFKDFLDKNSAQEGPFNLLRANIDGELCVGHGDGTFDYFVHDFS